MQREFVERGYVILRGAVNADAALDEMRQHFPADDKEPVQDFGSGNKAQFPSTPALNDIAVHPCLLSSVREILGPDIRLKQSVPWAKYGVPPDGESSNSDQRVHMDYGNNQYDMPTPGNPTAVAAIVYYSDTSKTDGATAVVPREGLDDPIYVWPYVHMPGISGNPFVNRRAEAEATMSPESAKLRAQCYAREVVPHFMPGDVLLYALDTWHRGTPVKSGHVRYSHNLMWAKTSTDVQQWNPGFTSALYSGRFERFIGQLEPNQLKTLGFPSPSDSRWRRPSFVTAMRARYEWAGFDVMKYVHSARTLPPQVPEHWYWSALRLETKDDPFVYREKLLQKMTDMGMCVQLNSATWHYTMETADPHYVSVECRFFSDGALTLVDINLLDGDRWTWVDISRRISGQTRVYSLLHTRTTKKTPNVSATPAIATMIAPGIDPRFFDMIGPDVKPHKLLGKLRESSPNIRRCILKALFACTTPFDVAVVAPYACIRPSTFLERRIKYWAGKILPKNHYVAHL